MRKLYILFLAAASMIAVSCSDFLDRSPLDQFSDDNFWTSENNMAAFAFELYNQFDGYGNGATTRGFYFKQFNDDMVSATLSNFTPNIPASSTLWKWEAIRKANVIIERANTMSVLSERAKAHWIGVGRFFRAYEYFNKVKNYGDVPWVEKSLDIADEDILYKPRDSRKVVMDNVLADLEYASKNMYDPQGDNRVNKDVALALMSRVCLHEGTFRKYHNLGDHEKFLQAAKDASDELMKKGYTLNGDYRANYNSVDLAGNPEMILYKIYQTGIMTNGISGFLTSSTTIAGLTKGAVESYLCTDGLPIGQSTLYQGDATITDVRTNRDERLLVTIDDDLCYVNHTYKGTTSSTGYKSFKFVNEELSSSERLAPNNPIDAPLFWISEIYLNYAEACAELGSISQSDLDRSINLLRNRAGVKPLIVRDGLPYSGNDGNTAVNDPNRDADVPAMIWEVRRERRTELMMDGFRYDDVMRWAKGEYLDTTKNPEIFTGAYIGNNYDPADPIIVKNGYIVTYETPRIFDPEKHYLEPIPSGQITLNKELGQNPGWGN